MRESRFAGRLAYLVGTRAGLRQSEPMFATEKMADGKLTVRWQWLSSSHFFGRKTDGGTNCSGKVARPTEPT